jgi:hypothetical protein
VKWLSLGLVGSTKEEPVRCFSTTAFFSSSGSGHGRIDAKCRRNDSSVRRRSGFGFAWMVVKLSCRLFQLRHLSHGEHVSDGVPASTVEKKYSIYYTYILIYDELDPFSQIHLQP